MTGPQERVLSGYDQMHNEPVVPDIESAFSSKTAIVLCDGVQLTHISS